MSDIAIRDWAKLGSTIRSERRRAGLSQQSLADRAGTSRSWLAKIEGGHRGAELEPMLKLLDALDLTMVLRPGDRDARAHDAAADDLALTWHRDVQAGRRRAWHLADEQRTKDDGAPRG